MSIAEETKTYTWTCGRCRCVLTVNDPYVPYGWGELFFDEHDPPGVRRYNFCPHCSAIIREILQCWSTQ